MRSKSLLFATGLILTAFAFPAAEAGDDCRDGAYATISGASADGVALQLNGQTFELARKLLALTISGDGYIEVDVTFRCIEVYHFTATKTGAISGTVTTVDDWQYPACGSGVTTYQLPVGLDLVDYHLTLDWTGCDGSAGHEERDITVVDPPVTGYLP
ncbi:MAG TPA: hypothetical protein VI997_04025 [Candidatus Thermoplasmatota archaeon]|nr:hypothetical protein [Candidatus Thermoplasmatota archaeon]